MIFPQIIFSIMIFYLKAITSNPVEPIPSPEPDAEPVPSPEPCTEPDPEPAPASDPEPDLVPELDPVPAPS